MSGKRWVEFVLPVLPGLQYTSASWVIKHKNGLHKIFTRINFSEAPHKVLRLSSVQREQNSQTCASQLVVWLPWTCSGKHGKEKSAVGTLKAFQSLFGSLIYCHSISCSITSRYLALHSLYYVKIQRHINLPCGEFFLPTVAQADCWGFLSVIVVLLRWWLLWFGATCI